MFYAWWNQTQAFQIYLNVKIQLQCYSRKQQQQAVSGSIKLSKVTSVLSKKETDKSQWGKNVQPSNFMSLARSLWGLIPDVKLKSDAFKIWSTKMSHYYSLILFRPTYKYSAWIKTVCVSLNYRLSWDTPRPKTYTWPIYGWGIIKENHINWAWNQSCNS